MAYRFNNGRGGVTCDQCGILYDADLDSKEYKQSYGKGKDGKDFCWECQEKLRKKEAKKGRVPER